jgi:YesN/AraC family two-component response regulator
MESIIENMNAIFAEMPDRNMSMMNAGLFCYDIVNCIFKTILEFSEEYQIPAEFTEEAADLIGKVQIDKLRILLNSVCSEFCSSVIDKKNPGNKKLRDSMLNFITKNYSDSQFSLETMSDKLGITPQYASRFFSSEFGMTFSEYVTELRFTEFIRLLITTEMPIKVIVTGIGYNDVTSFIRKFKKEHGITPGEYRKLKKM